LSEPITLGKLLSREFLRPVAFLMSFGYQTIFLERLTICSQDQGGYGVNSANAWFGKACGAAEAIASLCASLQHFHHHTSRLNLSLTAYTMNAARTTTANFQSHPILNLDSVEVRLGVTSALDERA
jgi:hypothetical protein